MAEQNLDIVVRIRGGQVVSQQVKTIGKDIEGVGTASEKTSKKTSGLNRALVGIATGYVAFKGAAYLKGAVNYTTSLSKATLGLQRVSGMDTQAAAGWVAVAKERGVESKQLNQGFITLAKNIHAAAGGSKSAMTAFRDLGVSQNDLISSNPAQILSQMSDVFATLPNGTEKAALAQKMFGRQAQALLPLISQGSAKLNEQTSAMGKQLGMTKDGAKSALELVKAQREWAATQNQLKVATATALLPVVLALTQALMPLIQMFANLMTHSKLFSSVVVALTAALVVMVATIWLANAGLFTLNAQVLLIPAIIAAVIVGFVLLYQKCAWFRDAVHAAMAGVVAAFDWVKNAAANVWNWIKGNWPLLVGIIGGPLGFAVAEGIKHFGALKDTAVNVFNTIKGVIQTVASFITSTLGGAFHGVQSAVQGVVDTIQTMIDTAKKIESLPAKALKALNPFGQHGLYMSTGGTAVVGEAGPEMVRLPQGAQVMPFMQGSARGGGGGQVVVPVYLDKRQIALAMGSYTADEQAAR